MRSFWILLPLFVGFLLGEIIWLAISPRPQHQIIVYKPCQVYYQDANVTTIGPEVLVENQR